MGTLVGQAWPTRHRLKL